MRRRRVLAATAAAVTAIVAGWAALTITMNASAETAGQPAGAANQPAEGANEPAEGANRTLVGPAGSPTAVNGQLAVCGVNLCNEAGEPIQLRGISSHGIQFFPDCLNPDSLDAIRNDWNADVVRIAMYVQEGGFETDPAGFTAKVNEAVETATELGLYVIIDFHILNPGDPAFNLERAKAFFADVAAEHADKPNVIYEIANEPNGVPWLEIKDYAEEVIPVIRAADPEGVVFVGTRGFSSLGVAEGGDETEVINDPVEAENIMYTFHFYAASHKDLQRATVARAAESLPLFVSEFGTQTFTGDGDNDLESATIWLDLLKTFKIGYAMWSFSDSDDTNSALLPGTCSGTEFAGPDVLSESGNFIRSRILAGSNGAGAGN